MKNKNDKTLKVILEIRSMRVNDLRSQRNHADKKMNEKALLVGNTQNHLAKLQNDCINNEQSFLSDLVKPDSVKVGSLVEFIKIQQHGVLQLTNAKKDIEIAQDSFLEARQELAESEIRLRQVEKKLVGIEEVIKKNLWK